jgi:Family of unknown function (DUF6498)
MRGFWEYQASAWALVVANAVPLLGVLLLGWDTFEIVALYWIENVIIGVINVLKMITCSPDPAEIEESLTRRDTPFDADELRSTLSELRSHGAKAQLVHHGAKLFLVPFFVFHYGIFCLVHGALIMAFFAAESFGGSLADVWRGFKTMTMDRHLGWAVAALAGSHLYSYFCNYLGRGEYRRTIVTALMIQPYARVVVLHIAILLGAFVVVALGSNLGVLILLILGKTVLDLGFHLREHEKNAANPKPTMPEEILDEAPRK